jgi:hypothetical protein
LSWLLNLEGGRYRQARIWWLWRWGYQRRIAASTSAMATIGATARTSAPARRILSLISLVVSSSHARVEWTGTAKPPYEWPP